MFAGLGLLLLAVPLIELYVIIKVGDVIGLWPTIALLIGVSIAGSMLLKREGMATWHRVQVAVGRGEMPTSDVTDGALIMLGGALLLTPGFVTDLFGLMLIVPFTRSRAKGLFRKVLGFVAVKRFPGAGATYSAGRRVYPGRVTDARRVTTTSSTPEQLPSEPRPPSGEGDSPNRR
jgi:UPF0716 protein FxsA